MGGQLGFSCNPYIQSLEEPFYHFRSLMSASATE